MTILWALEDLNADDPWTKKEYPCTFPDLIVPALLIEKTIHTQLIGAPGKEMENVDVFEEILHRLPEVKTLKVCGSSKWSWVFVTKAYPFTVARVGSSPPKPKHTLPTSTYSYFSLWVNLQLEEQL